MWTSLLTLLAATANILTWYLTKRRYNPELEKVNSLTTKYNILFAKYSAMVKERNQLRKHLAEAEKRLYEEATLSDIIDTINRLPKIGGDPSGDN